MELRERFMHKCNRLQKVCRLRLRGCSGLDQRDDIAAFAKPRAAEMAKRAVGKSSPGLGAWAIKAAASGLLIAVCLLDARAADSTIQPTTKTVTTAPLAEPRSDNREGRQNRGNNRDRRGNRDRGSSAATPISSVDPFAVLKARSIFVKGNQQITVGGSGQSSLPPGALVRKPEASLVFNGVTVIDGQANAFIEDLTADRVSTVRVGDGIAGGKVSAINFDTLSYEANGHVLNVALGQNLEGNAAVATGTDSTPGAPTTGPTTLPFSPGYIGVGAGSGVITSGMSPEDILARMKAKRQAELKK